MIVDLEVPRSIRGGGTNQTPIFSDRTGRVT